MRTDIHAKWAYTCVYLRSECGFGNLIVFRELSFYLIYFLDFYVKKVNTLFVRLACISSVCQGQIEYTGLGLRIDAFCG